MTTFSLEKDEENSSIFHASASFPLSRITLFKNGTKPEIEAFFWDVVEDRIQPRHETLEEFKLRGGLVSICPTRFAYGATHIQNKKRSEQPANISLADSWTRKQLAMLSLDDLLEEPKTQDASMDVSMDVSIENIEPLGAIAELTNGLEMGAQEFGAPNPLAWEKSTVHPA